MTSGHYRLSNKPHRDNTDSISVIGSLLSEWYTVQGTLIALELFSPSSLIHCIGSTLTAPVSLGPPSLSDKPHSDNTDSTNAIGFLQYKWYTAQGTLIEPVLFSPSSLIHCIGSTLTAPVSLGLSSVMHCTGTILIVPVSLGPSSISDTLHRYNTDSTSVVGCLQCDTLHRNNTDSTSIIGSL